MNLACATEVFRDLQGSGHGEIIHTGVHARTHAHTQTHTHIAPNSTTTSSIPWRAGDSQPTAGFQSRLWLKLAGAFIVAGEEGSLCLRAWLHGNAVWYFPHPP